MTEEAKKRDLHQELLANIKRDLPKLEELYDNMTKRLEEPFYRFYHQSFKVYRVQSLTKEIYEALYELHPEKKKGFDGYFQQIIDEGANGEEWRLPHNQIWPRVTRPFLEAFFHAHYFLSLAIRFGKELDEAPNCMPSGWAALTELYNIRYGQIQ